MAETVELRDATGFSIQLWRKARKFSNALVVCSKREKE